MQAHRITASFSNDNIVLKIDSVLLEKKMKFLQKVQKIFQRVAKKRKLTNPIHFITPVVYTQDITLTKNKLALYRIKLPMLKYA